MGSIPAAGSAARLASFSVPISPVCQLALIFGSWRLPDGRHRQLDIRELVTGTGPFGPPKSARSSRPSGPIQQPTASCETPCANWKRSRSGVRPHRFASASASICSAGPPDAVDTLHGCRWRGTGAVPSGPGDGRGRPARQGAANCSRRPEGGLRGGRLRRRGRRSLRKAGKHDEARPARLAAGGRAPRVGRLLGGTGRTLADDGAADERCRGGSGTGSWPSIPASPTALFQHRRCSTTGTATTTTPIDCYERSVNRYPATVGSLINLGLLYEDRDEFTKAQQCYKRILEAFPDHPRARLFLKDSSASSDLKQDEQDLRNRDRLEQILGLPVTDFELSVRSRNCLQKMGIHTLGDLARTTEEEILASKNFGETSLVEIKDMLVLQGALARPDRRAGSRDASPSRARGAVRRRAGDPRPADHRTQPLGHGPASAPRNWASPRSATWSGGRPKTCWSARTSA